MTSITLEQARTEALTRSRKGGFFEDVLTYETARQLALLHWLNPSGGYVTRRSLLERLMEDPVAYTPGDFCNFFILPGDIKDEIFDVFIFSMEYLAQYLRYNERPIVPDAMYPNLYLAYSRDKKHYLALEMTANETGLMHILIGDQAQQSSQPINTLTDDWELQQSIRQVYKDFTRRLSARNLPYKRWGGSKDIGLITPVEPLDDYAARLEQMLTFFLENGVQSEARAAFVPEKSGDAARRLKRLEMTYDDGYLPRFFRHRVYSGIRDEKPDWEVMPAVERAIHEKRFVDSGYLLFAERRVQVIVITLDKFDDTREGDWELFLLTDDGAVQVVLGRFYTVLQINRYGGTVGDVPESTHEPLTIAEIVEKWLNGFYLPGFAKTLLLVIEKRDGYVTDDSLEELLTDWLVEPDIFPG